MASHAAAMKSDAARRTVSSPANRSPLPEPGPESAFPLPSARAAPHVSALTYRRAYASCRSLVASLRAATTERGPIRHSYLYVGTLVGTYIESVIMTTTTVDNIEREQAAKGVAGGRSVERINSTKMRFVLRDSAIFVSLSPRRSYVRAYDSRIAGTTTTHLSNFYLGLFVPASLFR